jgi:hypothetical protein
MFKVLNACRSVEFTIFLILHGVHKFDDKQNRILILLAQRDFR